MTRAGVIGWPIAHSRSPLIHGHWLALHGIDGSYEAVPVDPARAEAFFADFRASGLAGANVTIPHKETAFRHVKRVSDVAASLGAVNTLWWDDGELAGTNTDVHGFLANLDERCPGWSEDAGPALVLGAGGAARAVVRALLDRGFDVTVANRTPARAEALADLDRARVRAVGLDRAADAARDARLVVNTTAAGLHGDAGGSLLDMSACREDAVAADIVYVPLVTPFLAAAAARGMRTVDGLGMLLHQAVPGFELWFGVRPEVTEELRALVLADIAR